MIGPIAIFVTVCLYLGIAALFVALLFPALFQRNTNATGVAIGLLSCVLMTLSIWLLLL